jgi:uncharacterized protein
MALTVLATQAQTTFPNLVELEKLTATMPTTIAVPVSPIKSQVLFVGGTDTVAHTAIAAKGSVYGLPAGLSLAKEWHDFIGFTPANPNEKAVALSLGHENFLGWISCNHEMIIKDNNLGDGGGMTVYGIKKDAATDSLVVIKQDLSALGFPAGKHKFFNVDFANTVGETGMNCGGISSIVDGRIWTAEEWFRTNNNSINNGTGLPTGIDSGVRDTADFTITTTDFAGSDFAGKKIKKFQNFNWMVEINPRTAKAIRKQYNWGRQGFEGGVIASDNKTVYTGDDNTPGLFTKFVADVAGDFTKGKTYVYKYDDDMNPVNNWIEINNMSLDTMMKISSVAFTKGATPFCRAEWVAYDKNTGKVYFTETGNDNWAPKDKPNATISKPMIDFFRKRNAELPATGLPSGWAKKDLTGITDAQIADSLKADKYRLYDVYGRITEYDPSTGKVRTFLEGGPFFITSPTAAAYPSRHLTNPDGLSFMYMDGKSYMIIQEDLNGRTFGRVPSELNVSGGSICEMFLLDMTKSNPTVSDLFKVAAIPAGAEITGGIALDDNTLLFNSQHPATTNPFPYNHSLTIAMTGFRKALVTSTNDDKVNANLAFQVYPNPASRELKLNKTTDVAIYNATGNRVMVSRNSNIVNISNLESGIYYVVDANNNTVKLVVE